MASEHDNFLLPWAKDGLFFCDTYVVTRAAWFQRLLDSWEHMLRRLATLNGANNVGPTCSCRSVQGIARVCLSFQNIFHHRKEPFVSYCQLRGVSGLIDMPRAPTCDLGGGYLESSTSKTLPILVTTSLLGQVLAGAILAALPSKMGWGLRGSMSISAQGTARVVFDLQREQRLGLISTLPAMSPSQ